MRAGRTVLEALEDFKSAVLPLEWLLQVGPHLVWQGLGSALELTPF